MEKNELKEVIQIGDEKKIALEIYLEDKFFREFKAEENSHYLFEKTNEINKILLNADPNMSEQEIFDRIVCILPKKALKNMLLKITFKRNFFDDMRTTYRSCIIMWRTDVVNKKFFWNGNEYVKYFLANDYFIWAYCDDEIVITKNVKKICFDSNNENDVEKLDFNEGLKRAKELLEFIKNNDLW